MKNVYIKYSDSGLNSERLILNAIVDLAEGQGSQGTVEVSRELSLGDIFNTAKRGLLYSISGGLMNSVSPSTGKVETYLQLFVA